MRLLSNGPEETSGYGFKLGSLLKGGDTVCLFGDLGSGKTTFVKGIASALAIPERDIASASFTIIAEYKGVLRNATIPFYHIDLYRIKDAGELDSIGIDEYIGRDGISVIEWAERLGEIEDSISVIFKILNGDRREITIEGIDEKAWDNM
ncbi:MAG: tRNA (adenosine(37)-N6)-threonylcarbamoyltransferase complex ATPase subunit type 1 TsaE [Thermodesulfovibrionales bacterium]